MSWLSFISVRAKLLLLLAVCSLGIAVVAGTALWSVQQAVATSQTLVRTEVAAVRTLGDVRAAVGNMRRFEKDLFLNLADETLLESYQQQWSQQVALGLEHTRNLQPVLAAGEHATLVRMTQAIGRYQTAVQGIVERIQRGEINDPWAANKAMEPAKGEMRAADASLVSIGQAVTARVDATVAGMAALERRAMLLTGASAVGVLGLAITLGALIARRIVRPLSLAVAAIERVAEGDLTQALHARGSDETARLVHGVQRMQDALSGIVVGIRDGVATVADASREIASANQDLSQRTERAATSLQQTAASMESLNQSVSRSTQAASQASALAGQASSVAARGGQVVGDVVNTMEAIHHSSQQIGDIISVIDGIAFQTNILALNAAVEAARAGEQGRGFAVVAAEVRSLAQRSADAAKQIKQLIGNSVDQVAAGSQQVAQAGSTMQDIVHNVRQVDDMIRNISTAATAQSQGFSQVGDAVNQLDQMTQQNAAMVEESAAAAASLREQAARLAEMVHRFRTTGGPAVPAAV